MRVVSVFYPTPSKKHNKQKHTVKSHITNSKKKQTIITCNLPRLNERRRGGGCKKFKQQIIYISNRIQMSHIHFQFFRRTMITLLPITSKLLCLMKIWHLAAVRYLKSLLKKKTKNTGKDNDQHLNRVRLVNGKNFKSTRYNV